MYQGLLRKARDLKRRSRTLRDQGDYQEAAKLLTEAIDLLHEPLKSAGVPEGVVASPDVRELATELADCFGSLGGIRRRQAEALRAQQQLDKAAATYDASDKAYEEGLALEKDDRYRIANSYNMVQSVVVPVLRSPAALEGEKIQEQLRGIRSSIQRQIDTGRAEDPWAFSDLGLVQLMAGDEAIANRTWDRMDKLQPQRNVYTSGLPVLEALSSALPGNEPLRQAAERFRANVSAR